MEYFFLIDNNSTDDYLSILSPYISKGLVTLFSNPTPKTQILNLNQYVLPLATLYTFIVPVDLDEFIYARNNFDTIRGYLSSLPDCVAAIAIPSKYFGTNGHIQQPDSVIYGNVRRRDWAYGEHDGIRMKDGAMGRMENIKTIVRSTSVKFFSLHRPTMFKDRLGMPAGITIQSNNEYEFPFYVEFNFIEGHENTEYLNIEHLQSDHRLNLSNITIETETISTCVTWIDEPILQKHNLHLNHYTLQSKEFYFNVKMKRGDATQNFKRGEETFKYSEKSFNQRVDNELERKTRRRRENRQRGG